MRALRARSGSLALTFFATGGIFRLLSLGMPSLSRSQVDEDASPGSGDAVVFQQAGNLRTTCVLETPSCAPCSANE